MLVFRREQRGFLSEFKVAPRIKSVHDKSHLSWTDFCIQEDIYMMTLQEILTYRGAYKVVPVADEMYADVRTPMEVFRIGRNISSHCYILESMEPVYE